MLDLNKADFEGGKSILYICDHVEQISILEFRSKGLPNVLRLSYPTSMDISMMPFNGKNDMQ